MTALQEYKLSGVALPSDPIWMLEEICEHFVEHAEVQRSGNLALLSHEAGLAQIRAEAGKLLIELSAPTALDLEMSRTDLAEHLFYFAGQQPFALEWSEPAQPLTLPNLHHVTVVGAEDITPRMRRVRFSCSDVTPFLGGEMHVQLLVPPEGRQPVWPSYRRDGRVNWPAGDDALLVRAYTIRAVDKDRGELWIDFLQHPAPGYATPGADFARDARPGMQLALLGPSSGKRPEAQSIFLAGDESALPAIARIAEEAPVGTRLQALIEVWDESEEQKLRSAATLDVKWLHRKTYAENGPGVLGHQIKVALADVAADTFVWVACEKQDVRSVRSFLKSRGHDRKAMYVAWYWEREPGMAALD
ncbi:MAG: phage tail protein [Devosia sp.]|jgi:NADPH-dependent ferric siderophore reductase|nr:phage tail protein [Devosia sp.]